MNNAKTRSTHYDRVAHLYTSTISQNVSTVLTKRVLQMIRNIIFQCNLNLSHIQLEQSPSETDKWASRWYLPKHTANSEMLMPGRQKSLHQQLPNKALFHTIIIQVRAAQTAAPAHTLRGSGLRVHCLSLLVRLRSIQNWEVGSVSPALPPFSFSGAVNLRTKRSKQSPWYLLIIKWTRSTVCGGLYNCAKLLSHPLCVCVCVLWERVCQW